MLLNLYRSNSPIAVFSLPLLIAALALPQLFTNLEHFNYLFSWQIELWSSINQYPFLNYALTVTIVAISAHQLNNVFNQNTFYSKNSFTPGFIYVLCLLTFDALVFTPMLLAHLFIILSLRHLFKLRRQDEAKAIIFWSGFFTGMAFLLAPMQATLILLPWIGLTIFRPFVWREWVMVILGAAIPLIYYASYMYISEGYLAVEAPEQSEFNTKGNTQLYSLINYIFFGLILIGSFYNYLAIARSEINRFKKQSQVLAHMTWLSGLSFLAGWYFYDIFYLGFLIPIAIIVGTQLLHSRNNTVVNGIVIIWLIISLANVVLGS